MNELNTRSLEGYNQSVTEKIPHIVVFIDEMADLMMTAGKEVEHYAQRLAQMARACGILSCNGNAKTKRWILSLEVLKQIFPESKFSKIVNMIVEQTVEVELNNY